MWYIVHLFQYGFGDEGFGHVHRYKMAAILNDKNNDWMSVKVNAAAPLSHKNPLEHNHEPGEYR